MSYQVPRGTQDILPKDISKWHRLEDLIRQHAADDFGTGIFCLTNLDYYDQETGIQFEAKDYIL